MGTLAQEHDCLLLDLDGTVFRGHELTEGAAESLEKTPGRTLFVTNNASRSAGEVATHLQDLGLHAADDDVVTSAQSAAHVLANQLAPGSRVLVVGTESLAAEITAVGLEPVRLLRRQAGRRRPGPLTRHRLGEPGRSGPGHPGRRGVGRRQRRRDAAD